MDMLSGVNFQLQLAAFCEIATRWSATTSSDRRASVERFGSIAKDSSAGPCPSTSELNLIHPALVDTDHRHSRAVVIRSVPDPPVASIEELLTAAVTPHRASLGPSGLMVVDPEPQPISDGTVPTTRAKARA